MLHLLRTKKVIVLQGLILLAAFIFPSHKLSAQKYLEYSAGWNQADHDSKPYYFGITLGVNSARFKTEKHPRFLQDDSVYVADPVNSPGFGLGLAATARISNRFQLRFNPQLVFTERSIFYKLKYADIDGTEVTKKVESVIMSFPVHLKFQSDRIGNFRVYMFGGVKADIDMASNARAKRAEDLVKIKKNDYGIEGGIGFNFFMQSFIFSPEIKISNGLGNIHSRDAALKYSSVFDRIQSRMIVFTIHLEG
jgi:hypothetical protein